jgi:hypothetical protein
MLLAVAFLIYLLRNTIDAGRPIGRDLATIPGVVALAAAIYLVVHRTLQFVLTLALDAYPSGLLTVPEQDKNPLGGPVSYVYNLLRVYGGDRSLYSIGIPLLGILIAFALFGLAIRIRDLRAPRVRRLLAASLAAATLLLSLVIVFFIGGYLSMRWLMGVPIALAGLPLLAVDGAPKAYRWLMALLVAGCIFQFVQSTNHLFGSSHIVLQDDRRIAAAMIERLNVLESELEAADEPSYLEVVGIPRRQANEFSPRVEQFGLSFFDIDQGSAFRVLGFLRTVGFERLGEAPTERRIELIEIARGLPAWPDLGSMRIFRDTVLVKFDDYTENQRRTICLDEEYRGPRPDEEFCKTDEGEPILP